MNRRRRMMMMGGGYSCVLPQNLLISSGTLMEDFENATDWAAWSGTCADDTVHFKTGTQSLELISAVGANSQQIKTINQIFSSDFIEFSLYVADPTKAGVGALTIYLSNDAGFGNYYTYSQTGLTLQVGWNTYRAPKSLFVVVGAGVPSWASAMIRLGVLITATAGETFIASYDNLNLGSIRKPIILINFDDCRASFFTTAYPILASRHLSATQYVISSLIDTAGYLTSAQLQAVNPNHIDIANHTSDHIDLTTLNQAQVQTRLLDCKDFLNALGLTRASTHIAYPLGAVNDIVQAAMTAEGMLTGRATLYYPGNWILPLAQPQIIKSYQSILNTTTLAAAKILVDTAKSTQQFCILGFHNIITTPAVATDWATADFEALCDYIVIQNVQTLTISELYALQSGSIRVSHR